MIVKAHLDALFSEEPIKRESYEALNHLISEYDRNLQQLEKIGEATEGWSTILVHMVCARLDNATLRHWEAHHSSKEVPSFGDLITFLRQHCAVLQSIAPVKRDQNEPKKSKYSVSHATTQSSSRCPFCSKEKHSAFRCQKFLSLSVSQRYDKVKRCRLCLNCLSSAHMVRACQSGSCQHCRQKHHTLLHVGSMNSPS